MVNVPSACWIGLLGRFGIMNILEVKKCERRPGINKLLTLLDLTKVSGLFRRVAILFETAFPRTLSLVCRVYRSFTLFSACS